MFFKRKKKLADLIYETKEVEVCGVDFVLRKINPLDHAKGLECMLAEHDLYTLARTPEKLTEGQLKKIKKHYRDVFLAAVVSPKLAAKDAKEDEVLADDLFNDPVLTETLYMEIMMLTYGKKKFSLSIMQEIESQSLT